VDCGTAETCEVANTDERRNARKARAQTLFFVMKISKNVQSDAGYDTGKMIRVS